MRTKLDIAWLSTNFLFKLLICKFLCSRFNHLSPIFFRHISFSLSTYYSQLLKLSYRNCCASPLHHTNHLNLTITEVIFTLSHIPLLLVLSVIIWSHIYLNILIYATFIFWTCKFLTDQHFDSYNISGLIGHHFIKLTLRFDN